MESIGEEIASHLKEWLGVSITGMSPIDKGWLNVKWRMDTEQGPLFVKYYHPERYKIHIRPDRKAEIERTLRFQDGLNEDGIPCPRVYRFDGSYIKETHSGLHYTVMEWLDGYTVPAGSMNKAQMHELGIATGRMHCWLGRIPQLEQPAWKPDKEAYLRQWKLNWDEAERADDSVVKEWLRRSCSIVDSTDFHIFDPSPIGWLHWDLWVDNILLREHGVAGIVDFDRMTMAYPEIDVARAVLSGALLDGQLDAGKVQAFMEGYRQNGAAPQGMLTRAFRMLYFIESIWWLRTEIRRESELSGLLARFVEEMHWIENNWDALPDRLDFA
ncbi:phosphotransferase enzyme family protein [Cohnella candidum]|nr:phosphotransferase [Cohnella candidum]